MRFCTLGFRLATAEPPRPCSSARLLVDAPGGRANDHEGNYSDHFLRNTRFGTTNCSITPNLDRGSGWNSPIIHIFIFGTSPMI